jgi:hypothetical protein
MHREGSSALYGFAHFRLEPHASSMGKKGTAPKKSMPRLWCDFNSVGWSGEEDDECYYSFDEKTLSKVRPREGMRVFIYEPGREGVVMGCEALLERYRHPITDALRWRLRPVSDTGYLGQLP